MSYLKNDIINKIMKCVELKSISDVEDIMKYEFDSEIKEYNDFLKEAKFLEDQNISMTHLLFYKDTNELIGYMTLSTDSIKLTPEEKAQHSLKVPFASIPAIKVGKLAINKKLSNKAKQKGYGSFLLEMARAYAFMMNNHGIACRFITVDADIEYDEDTPNFYYKNGFRENLQNRSRNAKNNVSMRLDIFS